MMLSFHDETRRHGDASGRRRRSGRSAAVVETLEGRELLSQLAPVFVAHAVHAEVAQHSAGGLLLGPILEKTGPGYVVKAPRFSQAYTGVPRSELSAAGFKAAFDGQGNLVLTGIVTANAVPQTALTAADDAYYIFGINRGSATSPGPFPGRPHLTLDVAVVVSVTQTGTTAQVIDQVSGQTTPLPNSSLLYKQNAIQVTVPLSVLTTVGTTNPVGWSADFITASALTTSDYSAFASFAPESHNITIANAGRSIVTSIAAHRRA